MIGEQTEDTPIFMVLCGVSHSGKSTFAASFGTGPLIINSDSIRKRLTGTSNLGNNKEEKNVWSVFQKEKQKALDKKVKNIVLDACHLSKASRWHAFKDVPKEYKRILVLFTQPFTILKKRVKHTKRIDFEIVKSMLKSFDRIDEKEKQERQIDNFIKID